jgi:multiple sugar transport system permease protein
MSASETRTTRRLGGDAFAYAALIGVSLLVAAPFIWVLSLSFKPSAEALSYPPTLLSANPTLENYRQVVFDTNFPRAFLNSTVVTVAAMVTNVLIAMMAGYAFARLKFPGRELLFYCVIATAMIPVAVTLIPLFLMAKHFPLAGGNDWLGQGGIGLLNSHAGLLLPHIVGPLNIFLARQFFLDMPEELAEAARIDGASEFLIFARVYLPLARPAAATIAILSFTGTWEDFLWPLVVSSRPEMHTLQLTLSLFTAGGAVQWGPLMAATVLVTAPVFVIFILNQRHFVEGLASGGVKG